MSDLLDWAEKSGLENIRFRLQNAETLAKEAVTTLTVLFAGMGAALAYGVKGVAAPHGLDAPANHNLPVPKSSLRVRERAHLGYLLPS